MKDKGKKKREEKRMKEGGREGRNTGRKRKKIRERTGKDLFPQFERDCKAQVHFVLPSP